MPVINGYEPGTPRWWLHYLVQKLIDEQSRYDRLEDYHLGRQPLPIADPKHVRMLRHFQQMAQTNYVTLVNGAPVGRMKVKDFQFGSGRGPDADAKRIWSANDMELQSKMLHSAASIFGDSYALVGPPDPMTGVPTMTVEDPRVAVVEPHPLYPTRSLAGLRMWQDVYLQQVVAVLYLPEGIYTYVGPSLNHLQGGKTDITNKLLGHSLGGGAFEQIDFSENTIGEVPLVHFEWQPDYNGLSLGESELILHIQDRINQMILDRLVTAASQAFHQRWAKGITPPDQKPSPTKKKPVDPPFELGSSHLWVTPNPDAEFGQFPAVDFKQMLEAVRDDIADIAAISQTPAHYLMNRMVNVSGDTLTQSESGFVSKTRLRMEAMGWGWERAMRLAFKFLDLPKANEPEATVLWADPMVRRDVEAADSASKWLAGGLELGLAMERFGDFSSEQIEFARQELASKQQQMLDLEAQSQNSENGPTDQEGSSGDESD